MTRPVHLSYATRDEVAAAVAVELARRFDNRGVQVSTTAHGAPPTRELAVLVLLLSSRWWADDAVQDASHSEALLAARSLVTGDQGGFDLPIVPAWVSGPWDAVAPRDLRRASPFDLRADTPHREAELDALVFVACDALPRPQGEQDG